MRFFGIIYNENICNYKYDNISIALAICTQSLNSADPIRHLRKFDDLQNRYLQPISFVRDQYV